MDVANLFPPFALKVGLSCLTAQIGLSLLLKSLPSGPWSKLPGVTAHQMLCCPLMIYLSCQGFRVWMSEQDELYAQGMHGRIFGVSSGGVQIGQFVWGMMLFWDIPTSLVVPSLQDTLMLMHHLGMLFVSGVSIGIFSLDGHPIGSYYGPFFFGMVELSTVFLTIVDLFHPKNKAWFTWVEEGQSSAARRVQNINNILRPVFAISYLVVRCGLFPYIMASTCLSDFWTASFLEADKERHGIGAITLKMVVFFSLAFTLLQLHWGFLVGRQVAKAVGLITDSKTSRRREKQS